MSDFRAPHYRYTIALYGIDPDGTTFCDKKENQYDFRRAMKTAMKYHKLARKNIKKNHKKDKPIPFTEATPIEDIIDSLITLNESPVFTEGYESKIAGDFVKQVVTTDYIKIYRKRTNGTAATLKEAEEFIK